jgi:hypothetical protein
LPAEILVPLFAVTLLANAILVAFAIRGLLPGSGDRDRADAGRTGSRPPRPPATGGPATDQIATAIAARRALVDAAAEERTDAPAPEPASEPLHRSAAAWVVDPAESPAERPDAPVAAVDPVDLVKPQETSPPAVALPGRPPATRRAVSAAKATSSGVTGPGRRARRRFSLPPLDDDHEKVNRSIETFLGGAEPVASDTTAGAGAIGAGATTVAFVAVDGLPPPPRRSRSAKAIGDDDATSSALAMVERTIRGAARGTDVVSVPDRGRFRIVLPGTGEVAARAYLRRIRATVEPLLESADRPLRLAVATATVLDEPLSDAVRRADRRLVAAIEALDAPSGPPQPGEPEAEVADAAPTDSPRSAEPKAAGD